VEKETYCSGEVSMEWLKDLEEEGSIGIDDGERILMAKTTNRPSRGNIRHHDHPMVSKLASVIQMTSKGSLVLLKRTGSICHHIFSPNQFPGRSPDGE
jgi:hypothetical protein